MGTAATTILSVEGPEAPKPVGVDPGKGGTGVRVERTIIVIPHGGKGGGDQSKNKIFGVIIIFIFDPLFMYYKYMADNTMRHSSLVNAAPSSIFQAVCN